MAKKIRAAIFGHGNVGDAAVKALLNQRDFRLVAVITDRPEDVRKKLPGIRVVAFSQISKLVGKVDVVLNCKGSKKDLLDRGLGQFIARAFTCVDSFDTHGRMTKYFKIMQEAALLGGNVAICGVGWDPGKFSVERLMADAFMPFWPVVVFYGLLRKGGLSMGHSDALRKLPEVQDALQYTHAVAKMIKKVRQGFPIDKSSDCHTRECLVVAKPGVDKKALTKKIQNMKHYFAPYKTTVKYVTQRELDLLKANMAHDGMVIANGEVIPGSWGQMQFRVAWESNPAATAAIMVAYARAAYRMSERGQKGAFSVADVTPADMSFRTRKQIIRHFI